MAEDSQQEAIRYLAAHNIWHLILNPNTLNSKHKQQYHLIKQKKFLNLWERKSVQSNNIRV
jgi:hypothetical protein